MKKEISHHSKLTNQHRDEIKQNSHGRERTNIACQIANLLRSFQGKSFFIIVINVPTSAHAYVGPDDLLYSNLRHVDNRHIPSSQNLVQYGPSKSFGLAEQAG